MKLEFRKITKSYGKTKALDRFSAVLEPGVHALLGPNGSGKSTTVKMILGLLYPTAGSLSVLGQIGRAHV